MARRSASPRPPASARGGGGDDPARGAGARGGRHRSLALQVTSEPPAPSYCEKGATSAAWPRRLAAQMGTWHEDRKADSPLRPWPSRVARVRHAIFGHARGRGSRRRAAAPRTSSGSARRWAGGSPPPPRRATTCSAGGFARGRAAFKGCAPCCARLPHGGDGAALVRRRARPRLHPRLWRRARRRRSTGSSRCSSRSSSTTFSSRARRRRRRPVLSPRRRHDQPGPSVASDVSTSTSPTRSGLGGVGGAGGAARARTASRSATSCCSTTASSRRLPERRLRLLAGGVPLALNADAPYDGGRPQALRAATLTDASAAGVRSKAGADERRDRDVVARWTRRPTATTTAATCCSSPASSPSSAPSPTHADGDPPPRCRAAEAVRALTRGWWPPSAPRSAASSARRRLRARAPTRIARRRAAAVRDGSRIEALVTPLSRAGLRWRGDLSRIGLGAAAAKSQALEAQNPSGAGARIAQAPPARRRSTSWRDDAEEVTWMELHATTSFPERGLFARWESTTPARRRRRHGDRRRLCARTRRSDWHPSKR